MVPTILKYELMKRGIRLMLKEYSRNVIFRASSKQNKFKVATVQSKTIVRAFNVLTIGKIENTRARVHAR